jgi:hypothetical protein
VQRASPLGTVEANGGGSATPQVANAVQ